MCNLGYKQGIFRLYTGDIVLLNLSPRAVVSIYCQFNKCKKMAMPGDEQTKTGKVQMKSRWNSGEKQMKK